MAAVSPQAIANKKERNRLWRLATYTPEYLAERARRTRERYAQKPRGWQYRAAVARHGDALTKATVANKTAKRYGTEGRLSITDVRQLWERQPVCLNCGRGRGLDHIVPLSKGGPNTVDNIQNLCGPCNQVKHLWDLPPGQIQRPPFDGDEQTCRWGHPRVTSMRTLPSGKRVCRPCESEKQRRYRRRVAARLRWLAR